MRLFVAENGGVGAEGSDGALGIEGGAVSEAEVGTAGKYPPPTECSRYDDSMGDTSCS